MVAFNAIASALSSRLRGKGDGSSMNCASAFSGAANFSWDKVGVTGEYDGLGGLLDPSFGVTNLSFG